jgi:hypothetical protein
MVGWLGIERVQVEVNDQIIEDRCVWERVKEQALNEPRYGIMG